MTAEVISREWGWDLKRIHLNPLVNKHIDETERNLEQVSSAEGSSRVVLLFDEADALFRERTEVKDSHDRLTNVEVSHHSQRLEDYRDLVILTTNQSEYIDEAFLGRLAQPHSRRKSTLNMYTYM
jgi:SpoVK/Ycf46/Vps4 family AAA+-type ATPase